MWMLPLYLHVNQRFDVDDYDDDDDSIQVGSMDLVQGASVSLQHIGTSH